VRYDDTPRRGKNAGVIVHDTSELFGKYFRQFYQICSKKAEPFVLITAWNEWGEGAYLEPDASGGYSYLEALLTWQLNIAFL
jgi:lipopolysaccharide biosynthesis protein